MLYSNILRKAEVLAAALDGVSDQVLSFPTPQVRPLQRRRVGRCSTNVR